METKFNVFEIFQIAEKIEHDGAKFYLKAAELFDDAERRDIFYRLANWKAKHEKVLADRRKHFSEKTGQFGTSWWATPMSCIFPRLAGFERGMGGCEVSGWCTPIFEGSL